MRGAVPSMRISPGFSARPGGFSTGRGARIGFFRFGPAHRFPPQTVFLPFPYFYPDYDYEPVVEQAPAPPVVVVTQPAEAPAPPPAEPLLIEWQGDHFVRMTLAERYRAQSSSPDYSEQAKPRSAKSSRKSQPETPSELPPAVLVFRDGHEEEVSSYTIMNGALYTKVDYWTTGAWTKKIYIADLDVPATLRLNQERRVKFVLPAGSNEVVIRP